MNIYTVKVKKPDTGIISRFFVNRQWFILTCLFLIVVAGRIAVLMYNNFANGFDGYYYALQVRSLMESGHLMNTDNSIVFWLLLPFALLVQDPITGSQLGAAALTSLGAIPAFLLLKSISKKNGLSALVTLVVMLGYSMSYMAMETVKNGIGIMFLIWFLWALEKIKAEKLAEKWTILALLFLLLCAVSHKSTAAMGAGIGVLWAAFIFVKIKGHVKINWFFVSVICLIAIILGVAVLFTLRFVDISHLLTQFDFLRGIARYPMIIRNISSPFTVAELLALQTLPVILLLIFLITKIKTPLIVTVCLILSNLITFPILVFQWDSIAYRLLMNSICLTMVPLVYWLSVVLPKNRMMSWIYGLLFSVSLLLIPAMRIYLHNPARNLDYAVFAEMIPKIAQNVPEGKKIICFQGLSFFVWYETRIPCYYFLDKDFTSGDYWRIVYGLGPVHFKPLRLREEEPPIMLSELFTLLPEPLWQRYYQKNYTRLKILNDWRNPFQVRPDFVYGKEKSDAGS